MKKVISVVDLVCEFIERKKAEIGDYWFDEDELIDIEDLEEEEIEE